MYLKLNSPVVVALQERLVEALPDVIAEINADVTDGFEIPSIEPAQVLPYIPPPSDRLQPPTIGIGDGKSLFEDDVGFSATGRHELLVVVYEQASDQEALAWILRRWTQAIATVALDGRRLGAGAWGTGLIGTAPGPTLADNPQDPQEWFSWSGLRLWAKRDED
jgi:hypothetical protein